MKYFFSLFVLFFLTVNSVFSQIRIIDSPNTSNFPEIEFTVYNRNPVFLSPDSFKFTELINGNKVQSDSVSISRANDSIDYSKSNKCVLILIETLLHRDRKEQNHTFKSAVLESLEKVVNNGDKFKIVTFSLKDDNTNILHDVNKTFTDNIILLKAALENHVTKDNDFTNKPVSDIYGAIIEGISDLDDFNSDLPKSILLLSDERNNSKINNLSNIAIALAKEKGVVINTIKYNRSRYYQFADPTLAKKTYGVSNVLKSSSGDFDGINNKKKEETNSIIESVLNDVVERSLGIQYNVLLKLNNTIKDGENHVIDIKINGSNDILKLNYKAPGNWVVAQFQTALYRSSFVLFVLILIVGFFIYYLWKRVKAKQLEKLNSIIEQQEKEAKQEDFLLVQKEELLNIKNEQEKLKIAEQEEIKKINQKALIKQMLSSGSFPILKFSDSNGTKQFQIDKPVVKIGRDKSLSTICISNNNISRNHFSIVFKNNQYKVIDNNSTNGIKLNGRMTKESVIKHADIIEIADLSFTFYE